MTVRFQTGEEDVEQPEAEEKGWCGESVSPWAPKFPSDVGPAPVEQHGDCQEGEDGEEGDGEGERAGRHHKVLPLHVPVDGRHRPGHADPQKDVDGVAARHISDGGVSVGVLDCRDFTGEHVWEAETFILHTSDAECSKKKDAVFSPHYQ